MFRGLPESLPEADHGNGRSTAQGARLLGSSTKLASLGLGSHWKGREGGGRILLGLKSLFGLTPPSPPLSPMNSSLGLPFFFIKSTYSGVSRPHLNLPVALRPLNHSGLWVFGLGPSPKHLAKHLGLNEGTWMKSPSLLLGAWNPPKAIHV